jgi:hypothetical protein
MSIGHRGISYYNIVLVSHFVAGSEFEKHSNLISYEQKQHIGFIDESKIGHSTDPDYEMFLSLAYEEVRGKTEELFAHRLFWRFFVVRTDKDVPDVMAEHFPKLREFYDKHLERVKEAHGQAENKE